LQDNVGKENKMFKKMFLSKTITIKTIAAITAGFLILSAVLPLSNFQVRALFVSIELIGKTPDLLDAVSLSQINDIVMKSIMSELDNIGGLPIDGKKSKPVNTNIDCALTGSISKKAFKIEANLNNLSLFGINSLSVHFADLLTAWDRVDIAKLDIIGTIYLEKSIQINLSHLISMSSLARGDTGFGYINTNINAVLLPSLSI
jgi:hypothetical protein